MTSPAGRPTAERWFDPTKLLRELGILRPEEIDVEAIALLLPESLLSKELDWDQAVTFRTIRDICRRYGTPFMATAERVVWLSPGNKLLVRSALGEFTKCLRRSDTEVDSWLHDCPRPGSVAWDLLHGARESPGATTVGSDGWLKVPTAWWCEASEDSLLRADGEVLSLLCWPGVAMVEMCSVWPEDLLPREPGEECVKLLARCLAKVWGYVPVAWADGELVMETQEPSLQRVVIPRSGLDAAGIRGLVAEVARQTGTTTDGVVEVLMTN